MDALKQQAIAGFEAGKSDREIGREIDRPRSTIWYWRQQWKRDREITAVLQGEPALPSSDGQADRAEPVEPATPEITVGSTWRARCNGCETYGAFMDVYAESGQMIGKGLLHRTRMFLPSREPRHRWSPDDFLPPGTWVSVEVLNADNLMKLSLATRHIDLYTIQPAPIVSRGVDVGGPTDNTAAARDILRLKGKHRPRVVISALEAAIATLGEMPADEPCTVSIEVRR